MMLRTPGRLGLCLFACLTLTATMAQAQPRDLEKEKAQAVQQQQALRNKLESLQGQLAKTQQQQSRAADALQRSEVAISATVRRLEKLDVTLRQFEADLSETESRIEVVNEQVALQSEALAKQLRAQYSSGLNEWSALLAGEDPQALGRDLGYLEFVSRSRTETIEKLRNNKKELSALRVAQNAQKVSIEQTKEMLAQERELLVQEKEQRQKVLVQIEKQLAQERSQASQLAKDEERLSRLIQGLSVEIERWRQEQALKTREAREAALATLPQGSGVKRGMSRPVQGRTLARFGSKRPEGGSWRGVLLDASEGEPVRAVASGTVVFSKWLRGFGNILIIDHGDDFLTVYAYNQSLLKDAGDIVESGDVVASAGNTGGQLESALYFELRHRGNPLDPMLYFKSQ
ncbi:murein hydrolase activator EnvC family protein [Orrella marina]|uniref:Peptidase n=1 Tax=Orrella marina TaxID=2163011 RepID=A0A2R4XMG5_9BURK|nr:peptidoglycan DD-metalloendopeptidase family protein [Orrella marina]AWB34992.1 peptidase [Orrella marina]